MRASRSSPVGGGDKGHSESAPAVHGPSGLTMADVLDVSFPHDACQSNEKAKVLADPPPPEMYVKVALAVEEDGTALLIFSSSASKGRAEKESIKSTPHSPTKPICTGGSDYVPACCEAGENKEAEALEFIANRLPSLPPSPPPMHVDEGHGEPGRAGSSQLPEGHELEDRDEVKARSDSGETDATNNDFTALARNARDGTAPLMRPISPVTELRFDREWRVRPSRAPQIGAPLPATAHAATTPVALEPSHYQDVIFSTFAARLLPGGEDMKDYTTNTGHYYTPRPSPIYHSHQILWVERSGRTTAAE
eukprot:2724593-Pleurochrysis_carterae.AAC.1